ncbi:hypothetical protein [Actinoallomurus sp. NPDC052274]|uniref:hypothetical protein n=1 Tax=Actinoallomurus sp. NPDC052274 TaxID=3155420 RepID=UPI00343B078F
MARSGLATRGHHQHAGVMVSGALALGVVLISARPGSSKDLTAALVGSPLTAGTGDIAAAAGAAGLAISLHYRIATAAGTAVICGTPFALAATISTLTTRSTPARQRGCDVTAT